MWANIMKVPGGVFGGGAGGDPKPQNLLNQPPDGWLQMWIAIIKLSARTLYNCNGFEKYGPHRVIATSDLRLG